MKRRDRSVWREAERSEMDVATGGWKRYRQSVEMCAKDSQMRRHGLALGSVAPLFRRKGEEEEEDR